MLCSSDISLLVFPLSLARHYTPRSSLIFIVLFSILLTILAHRSFILSFILLFYYLSTSLLFY